LQESNHLTMGSGKVKGEWMIINQRPGLPESGEGKRCGLGLKSKETLSKLSGVSGSRLVQDGAFANILEAFPLVWGPCRGVGGR
jgi:hypothetical protein